MFGAYLCLTRSTATRYTAEGAPATALKLHLLRLYELLMTLCPEQQTTNIKTQNCHVHL